MSRAFKGWKKVADEKDHAVLEHDSGHSMKIAKSALTPKMRGQLAEIPVHSLENNPKLEQSKADTNPAGKKAIEDNKGKLKMASGGQAWNQSDKEAFAAGARGEAPVKKSKPLSANDIVTNHEETSDTDRQVSATQAANQADPSKADALAKTNAARAKFLGLAKGGQVPKYADGILVPEQADAAPAKDELIPGVPQTASNPQAFEFEQKQQKLAQSMAGNYPDAAALDQATANAALDQIDGEKRAGAQASAAVGAQAGAAYQQAVDLNKRLEAAGLPTRPMPPAPGSPDSQAEPISDAGSSSAPPAQPSSPVNNDPYGTQATQNAYMQGLGEEKQGLAGEARALGAQGQVEAKVAHDNAVNKQNILDSYQNENATLNKQRQDFIAAYQKEHIDPNHYLGSMDTGRRISTAIGLILGGIGGGLTGQENPALKMLNMNIDRDIDAQKASMGQKKSLLEFNMQQFGNLREATNMTKVMMNDIASDKFKEAAAKAMDPLAKSRALQAAGKLDQQSAAMIGQYAMRKTMLNGLASGKVAPESVVEFAVPQESRPAARKELKDMKDAVQLRDNTLSAFDQIAKLNTVGNRMMSPIQSKRQIDAIQGPVLDKLTKDTSGRVTPETVGLIQKTFSRMGNSPETVQKARNSILHLVSQGMNYPTLEAYHITPDSISRFNSQGKSNIPTSAPVPNKAK